MNLIELKPGVFLNVDHVVSVRVLPQEEGDDYAMLQLSNGDTQRLTRAEFTAVTGQAAHAQARLSQRPAQ